MTPNPIAGFLADLTLLTTTVTTAAVDFGQVLLAPPFSIFVGLAVLGIAFSWFRGFIGSRG